LKPHPKATDAAANGPPQPATRRQSVPASREGAAAVKRFGSDSMEEIGAPGTIRTSDPQIRSLMLYPAELRARIA
jgi:hypothetical protein